MLLFDVGANYGGAVLAGLEQGYKVVALEPAPRAFSLLVNNFIYNADVIPLKVAVSDKDGERVEFYEADEDGLSTLNKEWLTGDTMPYKGKPFRTITATTMTLDTLVSGYGVPDLIKIDVEGGEWFVFRGMTKKYGIITFEWTDTTLEEHHAQLEYLAGLGYKEIGPQFIGHHLKEPKKWYSIKKQKLSSWVEDNKDEWTSSGWREDGLRPTADVGMCWVR